MKDAFIIRLPSKSNGSIRKRTVYIRKIFSFRKDQTQLITVYVIYFNNLNIDIEFQVFRTLDNEWFTDLQGNTCINDEFYFAIKNEILRKERKALENIPVKH